MKLFTDIKQGKKLAKILPIESADMWWSYDYDIISDIGEYDKEPMLHKPVCDSDKAIPCWSLAALLNILPETIKDEFAEYDLEIDMIYKKPEYVRLCDCHHSDFPSWEWDDTKELLDNIVEAVIWLNNNGYLQYDL